METKGDLYSFSPSVFAWHEAKKVLTASMHGQMLKRKIINYGYEK